MNWRLLCQEWNRHEIKQMYADYVFEKLELLLKKE